MSRLLGLDIGEKRIGIAISDAMGWIATPHSVYLRVGYGPDVRHIQQLMQQLGADSVVVGLPRNMDGSLGPSAMKAQAFADKLTEAGIPVTFWDERLSTVSAQRSLIEGGMRRQQRRDTVDKVAAAVILQAYLDAHTNQ
ncbi:MAG TPA: Holliday junction resolvase RuvX [Clostridiales bacterium]|nr:Holliday junction resolvase RuvX [Clostridiales bacterium]